MPSTLVTWTPPPLSLHESVEEALGHVMEADTDAVAVVDPEGKLLGVLSEELLLEAEGPDAALSSLLQPFPPLSIYPDAHVFEATKLMVSHHLAALPVTDREGHYLGFARRHDIFERFACMLATQEEGAVVSLRLNPRDYALSKLVHTIEQNGVKIRSILSEQDPESDEVFLTLKLNVQDSSRVRHLMEHYGYAVVNTYGESGSDEELSDRVQAFMRYLEV